jgi:BirA family biotin operon repressor/biotin-[acetyl-CoA-carboxylase] ligase
MLDEPRLRSSLPVGRIGAPLYFLESTGSTNDIAAEKARAGSPEGTLVVALEQTAGKGRLGRKWDTEAGSGLALSIVLRPGTSNIASLGLIGAMAAIEALDQLELRAQIKWPNDVLLAGRKVAGVLAEASWVGAALEYVILGIGVNVTAEAVTDSTGYDYPATYLESELESKADQNALLLTIVGRLSHWYERFLSGSAHPDWEERLAFKDEEVWVTSDGMQIAGRLLGLGEMGELRLAAGDGSEIQIEAGASSIRPKDSGLA